MACGGPARDSFNPPKNLILPRRIEPIPKLNDWKVVTYCSGQDMNKAFSRESFRDLCAVPF